MKKPVPEVDQQERIMRWQPLMLVTTNGERLDCGGCGANAIFIVGHVPSTHEHKQKDEYPFLTEADSYCQSCFTTMMESVESE